MSLGRSFIAKDIELPSPIAPVRKIVNCAFWRATVSTPSCYKNSF